MKILKITTPAIQQYNVYLRDPIRVLKLTISDTAYDPAYVFSSDPIEPELNPSDPAIFPSTSGVQHNLHLSSAEALHLVQDRAGYELRPGQIQALERLYRNEEAALRGRGDDVTVFDWIFSIPTVSNTR